MVPSGFRRIAHLCFINQFSKKWHQLASTASDRKGAKIQFFNDIWYFFCWRLLRPAYVTFLKIADETQISKPPEPTRHHNLMKLLILLPLRADLLSLLCKLIVKKPGQHKLIQVCLHFIGVCLLEKYAMTMQVPFGNPHCTNMRHLVHVFEEFKLKNPMIFFL